MSSNEETPLSEERDVVEGTQAGYQVLISMNQQTVQALMQNNFYLYGFMAVQSTQGGGAPLVWFQTQGFLQSTAVQWTNEYLAYTSMSQIMPNSQVVASFATEISTGQTLQVQQGGFGTVVNGGPNNAISILNQSFNQLTCGISRGLVNSTPTPICAFPLYGNNMSVIVPVAKVLLMFSTIPLNTGTVIEQAFSPGILIDLTNSNQQNVSFDINQGWSWGGGSWAQQVPYQSSLIPLLIEYS